MRWWGRSQGGGVKPAAEAVEANPKVERARPLAELDAARPRETATEPTAPASPVALPRFGGEALDGKEQQVGKDGTADAMVAHVDRSEMIGPDLALRCYELNALATRVRDCLVDDLARLGVELSVYRFAHRTKGQENIQNKVLRKRDEIKAQSKRDTEPRRFHAEDVTDAWGCRFVTLFQSQILDVMSHVFRLIERWSDQGHEILIDVVEVYTNRPDNDPTSIAPNAEQLIRNVSTSYFVPRSRICEIKYRVDSRDSGYSAIHFVLGATLPRRVNREEVPDSVKFEIQIRDIFEEAWSQVSHTVSYGEKDSLYETGTRGNSTVELIARPQLNALKTVADGCSQLADQIRRTYDDLRGRLSIVDPSSTYLSVVPLRDVRDFILARIPDEREVLIEAIKTAYGLVQDARDAADKYFDNRVARSNYLAAAQKFEEAISRAGETLGIVLPDGKTIEWYLTIEQANALIFSLPTKLKDADEAQRLDHQRACELYHALEVKFPSDHVVQLRRAQAQRKATHTEIEATGAIRRLENCLALLGKGVPSLRGESDLTDHLVRIELGLARLDYSEYVESREAKERALREAVRDVQTIIAEELPETLEPELLRIYHRALSNVLWFYHRLRAIAGATLSETDFRNHSAQYR